MIQNLLKLPIYDSMSTLTLSITLYDGNSKVDSNFVILVIYAVS